MGWVRLTQGFCFFFFFTMKKIKNKKKKQNTLEDEAMEVVGLDYNSKSDKIKDKTDLFCLLILCLSL